MPPSTIFIAPEPPVILAIETSTTVGSLAVRRGGRTIYAAEFSSQRTHNAVLFAPLAEALRLAPDVTQLLIGSGPGSYTGVRVGIAAAIGLSLARGLPLCGGSSLLGLAGTPATFLILGDARRGLWHFTEICAEQLSAPPRLGTVSEVRAWAAASPLPCYALDATVAAATGFPLVQPSAEILATRAEGWPPSQWAAAHALALEPTYLSPPFITTPRPTKASATRPLSPDAPGTAVLGS